MSADLTDPIHRNWVWRTLQLVFQNVFVFCLKYRARGIEQLPEGGALFLINHQSFLDPMLVGLPLKRPVSFLARDSLFQVPVVGWVLKNTYAMPINRESAGTDSIRKSVAKLEQGFYVGMFPEGTRSTDGQLGVLKPGFLALVRRSNVPVIPVGIAGANAAFPKGSLIVQLASVCVVFGKPIDVETVAALSKKGREQEFMELVQVRLSACVQEAETWRSGTW